MMNIVKMALMALVLIAGVSNTEARRRSSQQRAMSNDCESAEAENLSDRLVAWLGGLLSQGSTPQGVVDIILSNCDANGNGYVEVSQFSSCMKAGLDDSSISNECYDAFTSVVDRSGDGAIDSEELGHLLSMLPRPPRS